LTHPLEVEPEPVDPELPESPVFKEPAAEAEPASPVDPELAFPEESLVELSEEEPAEPDSAPSVSLSDSELPEAPEEELVEGFEVAEPVEPEEELAVEEEEEVTAGAGSAISETLWGFASEEPEPPEEFDEPLVEEAPPLLPVVPEVVSDPVLVSPEAEEEVDLELEDTAPEVPPAPESPEVALGSEVAFPELTAPVEPLEPLAAAFDPSQLPS
jgi:hypothetical protein